MSRRLAALGMLHVIEHTSLVLMTHSFPSRTLALLVATLSCFLSVVTPVAHVHRFGSVMGSKADARTLSPHALACIRNDADYARRDPRIPGQLPGCQPIPPPPSRPLATALPIPQTKIASMSTRHELRQALGVTFNHMAEAQLIKMLRALASQTTDDSEKQHVAGETGNAAAAHAAQTSKGGNLNFNNLVEAFRVFGVNDVGLLRRFWSTLSEAAGGQPELGVRFVTEGVYSPFCFPCHQLHACWCVTLARARALMQRFEQ